MVHVLETRLTSALHESTVPNHNCDTVRHDY
jgi:hypothetical protein